MGISKKGCDEAVGTEQDKWEQIYGTSAIGNLPQYKRLEHVGHIWAPCPYSTQSSDLRSSLMLGSVPTKVNHTGLDGKVYYMRTHGKNSVWGFECTFESCPFFLNNGVRFFYV